MDWQAFLATYGTTVPYLCHVRETYSSRNIASLGAFWCPHILRGDGFFSHGPATSSEETGAETAPPCSGKIFADRRQTCPAVHLCLSPRSQTPRRQPTPKWNQRAQDNDEGRGAAPRERPELPAAKAHTYAAPSRVRWPRPACRRTAHPSSVDTRHHHRTSRSGARPA